jgi:hypothetical protein
MKTSRSNENLPSTTTDEALVQAIQHWGERDQACATTSASVIQRSVADQIRRTRQITLVASTVLLSAILSTAWMAQSGRKANSPTNVAMTPESVAPAPERLLESISERVEQIESQMKQWDAQREQEKNIARERDELHASLLQYKRIAIRNRIAMQETP